jgi:hypothetical protein
MRQILVQEFDNVAVHNEYHLEQIKKAFNFSQAR